MSEPSEKNFREAVEGVIINNYFLTQDQFKQLFKEDNIKELKTWKNSLLKDLNFFIANYNDIIRKHPMEAYTIWENITKRYFNNTEVKILVATGLNEEKSEKMTVYANNIEGLVLSESSEGLTTDIAHWNEKSPKFTKEVSKNIITTVATSIVENHYKNMAKTITTDVPTPEEITYWETTGRVFYKKKYTYTTEKFYATQVFGKENYGQIWEAYMHHLAHYHGWDWTTEDLKGIENSKVRDDEEKELFLTTIHAAKNNYSFTKGGDLVIVDKEQNVKANIQIKGSGTDTGNLIGNSVSSDTTLKYFLKPLWKALNNKNGIDVNKIYNILKNEAWIDKVADKTTQDKNVQNLIETLKSFSEENLLSTEYRKKYNRKYSKKIEYKSPKNPYQKVK